MRLSSACRFRERAAGLVEVRRELLGGLASVLDGERASVRLPCVIGEAEHSGDLVDVFGDLDGHLELGS
jgi:hypothetical protein